MKLIKYKEFIDGELARVIVVSKESFIHRLSIELHKPYITFVELDVFNGTLEVIMEIEGEHGSYTRTLTCEAILTDIQDDVINLINKKL